MTIESRTGEIELIDGRLNHNNGWYHRPRRDPGRRDKRAPRMDRHAARRSNWRYEPVIQVSQVGTPRRSRSER